MGRIDDLIQKYCPCGVEYKTLGELGKFYGGVTGKSKEDFKGGNAKFISYMNVYTNPELDLSTNDKIRISLGERQNTLEYGDVVFTGSSETADECGISSVLTVKPNVPLYLNSFCFFFRFNDPEIMLPGFSKHLFRSYELRKQIRKAARGVTRFNISKTLMRCVEIPVPPLEVQREIVHILDSFTLLTAELTAELTARKKQYTFYRDELLSFDRYHNKQEEGVLQYSGVRYSTLGELGNFYGGLSGKSKSDFVDGNSKFITYKNVYSNLEVDIDASDTVKIAENEKQRALEFGDIVFTGSSETIDECGVCSVLTKKTDEKLYLNSFCFIFRFDDPSIMLPGFSKYLFSSRKVRNQILKTAHGVTRFNISKQLMKDVKIAVPPLEVQKKIVEVLDNFEAICSDLKIGLPAEIEAREKQYAYYRDKLLSFTKIEQDTSSILDKLEILNNDMIECAHAEIEARQKQYEYYRDNLIIFDPKR